MITKLPYDIASYLTDFMCERDLINLTKAQKVFDFHELALKRLETQLENLTLMSITSEVDNGRQTLTNNVLSLKERLDNSCFIFEVRETPIVTHFDSSYLKKSGEKQTTVWFGSSRHSLGHKGIMTFQKSSQISVHYDLLLTAIGQ